MTPTLLSRDLRPIRRLAPPDAPCDATLVMMGSTAHFLVDVDDESCARVAPFVGAEHVWAPTDVHRREGGHDLVMPRLVQTLEVFVERRRHAPMSAGEIVTVACSVLRGAREVGEADGSLAATGRWWLTDSGRPVFALGSGEPLMATVADACELLVEHAQDRALTRVLVDGASMCATGQTAGFVDIERQLIQIAAPRPVELDYGGSSGEPAPPLPLRATRGSHRVPADGGVTANALPPRAWRAVWGRVLTDPLRLWRDARARLAPSRSVVAAPASRLPADRDPLGDPRRPSKKRLGAVAALVAGAVVVVGLVFPDDDDTSVSVTSSAEGHPASEDTLASPTPAPDPSAASGGSVADSGQPPASGEAAIVPRDGQPELTMTAAALFADARDCEANVSCADLVTDPTLVERVPAAGVVEIVDDYGGIAVFSVEAPDLPDVTIVIEKRGEQWMIREIYSDESAG